jgi:hypothetical protein
MEDLCPSQESLPIQDVVLLVQSTDLRVQERQTPPFPLFAALTDA